MDPILTEDARRVITALGPLNQRFADKTILLTGAAGFLGSHFIHYFLALNDSSPAGNPCRLIAWDNFSRGTPPWLKKLPRRPDLVRQTRDITRKHTIPPVDFIIHAASIASPIALTCTPAPAPAMQCNDPSSDCTVGSSSDECWWK